MNAPWTNVVPPPPGTTGQYGREFDHPSHRSHHRGMRGTDAHLDPPAYHPVQVRQTFNPPPLHYMPMAQQQYAPPPPPSQPAEAPAPRKKIDWPQPVRNYVQRSFEPQNLLDDVPRSEMEVKLKATITSATDSNTLETIDWDNLPLPQQMIRAERAQAAISWQQESVDLRMGGNGPINTRDVNLKKRKSQEIGGDEDSNSTPPWRTTNNRNALEDRITFDKRQQPFHDDTHKGTSKFQKNLEKRQKRFDGGYKSTYKASPSPEPTSGPVVGTCQVLEKQYFRLTSAPNPSQVRPEPILRQTLDLLLQQV
jgi:hypothetical protein